MKNPFFTESDFCDEAGYWKSREHTINRANEKTEKLVAALEKVLRQEDQSGYPTTAEWYSIHKAAKEALKLFEVKS